MKNHKKTLVVIPALNEEGSIASVIDSIRSSIGMIDIVVINDGSSDRTEECALKKKRFCP